MIQNQSAAVDFNTAATQSVVAGVAGKRIVVYGLFLVNGVATAQTVQFKTGSSTLTGVLALPSAVGGGLVASSGHPQLGLFTTANGDALSMVMSAATQVGGSVLFKYVPA